MNPCEFCGVRLLVQPRCCRCGQAHKACKSCWMSRARVVGEFPNQDYGLNECPPKKEVRSGS